MAEVKKVAFSFDEGSFISAEEASVRFGGHTVEVHSPTNGQTTQIPVTCAYVDQRLRAAAADCNLLLRWMTDNLTVDQVNAATAFVLANR